MPVKLNGPAASALCALLFLVLTAIAGLYYCALPPSPDQSIFDYVGFIAARGGTYYRDAFDISWPGPFLYHELGVRLFGAHGWTARLTDLVLLLPVGLVGLWLFARNAGLPWAGIALVLLYPSYYVTSGGWMAGHRDIDAMEMLILAAALLMGRGSRRVAVRIAVGAIVAYVTMVRPTYLFALLPFWLIEMAMLRTLRERAAATGQAALGLVALFLAFLAAGLIEGTVGDWYEQAILFPTTVYQVPLSRARLFPILYWEFRYELFWPTLAGIAGACVWMSRLGGAARRSPARFHFLGLVATSLVSFFVQNKGFGYHLGGLVPLLLLSGVMGIEAAWRGVSGNAGVRRSLPAALGLASVVLVGTGMAARVHHYLMPAARLVATADLGGMAGYLALRDEPAAAARLTAAEVVRSATGPDERVLQWGWNYEIPFLAERLPATHLINTNLLTQIRPEDTRLAPWLDRLARDLTRDRVALIVIDRTVLAPAVLADPALAGLQPGATRIMLALARQGYRPIFDQDNILILRRDGR